MEIDWKRTVGTSVFYYRKRRADPNVLWNVEYQAPYLCGANALVIQSALQMSETAKDFRIA